MNLKADIQPAEYGALMSSKTLVLTGAGASVPFEMPAMDGFLDLINKGYHALASQITKEGPSGAHDLEYLLGRLTFYENILNELSRDQILRNWINPNSNNLGSNASQLRAHIFERIVRKYGHLSAKARTKAYEFLFPLLESLRRTARNNPNVLPIFTTNYDLAFEDLETQVPDFSIVNGMRRRGLDFVWEPSSYRTASDYHYAIFRLHGCSHWTRDHETGEIVYQSKPDTSNPEYRNPCVLYPVPGKEDRIFEDPYRTAYIFFEKILLGAKNIILMGYSGRDPMIQTHLNEAIGADPGKRLTIVTKGPTLSPELQKLVKASTNPQIITDGIEKALSRIVVDDEGNILIAPAD